MLARRPGMFAADLGMFGERQRMLGCASGMSPEGSVVLGGGQENGQDRERNACWCLDLRRDSTPVVKEGSFVLANKTGGVPLCAERLGRWLGWKRERQRRAGTLQPGRVDWSERHLKPRPGRRRTAWHFSARSEAHQENPRRHLGLKPMLFAYC